MCLPLDKMVVVLSSAQIFLPRQWCDLDLGTVAAVAGIVVKCLYLWVVQILGSYLDYISSPTPNIWAPPSHPRKKHTQKQKTKANFTISFKQQHDFMFNVSLVFLVQARYWKETVWLGYMVRDWVRKSNLVIDNRKLIYYWCNTWHLGSISL